MNTELYRFRHNLQRSSVPAGGGRNGVEPSPSKVAFIRASGDQESAFQIAPNHSKLVQHADKTLSKKYIHHQFHLKSAGYLQV